MSSFAKVTHSGEAIVGGDIVRLVVLDNKQRVIASSSTGALISDLPKFAETLSLTLDEATATRNKVLAEKYRVNYQDLDGSVKEGFDVVSIVDIADNCLQYGNRLRESGVDIPEHAKPVLTYSREIMVQLARVGMSALIDEAAGYKKGRKILTAKQR